MRLVEVDDLDEAKEIHRLAFPDDAWPGDDHTYWFGYVAGTLAAFCSAVLFEKSNSVFLSRAAVTKPFEHMGFQRQMIRRRVAWARRHKASAVVTYTVRANYASIINLLRCGFRFDDPNPKWAGKQVQYFRYKL